MDKMPTNSNSESSRSDTTDNNIFFSMLNLSAEQQLQANKMWV